MPLSLRPGRARSAPGTRSWWWPRSPTRSTAASRPSPPPSPRWWSRPRTRCAGPRPAAGDRGVRPPDPADHHQPVGHRPRSAARTDRAAGPVGDLADRTDQRRGRPDGDRAGPGVRAALPGVRHRRPTATRSPARGQGAPVIVNGTLQARPVFRGALVRALVLTLVIALWVGLAVVALPRVSSYFTAGPEDRDQHRPADLRQRQRDEPVGWRSERRCRWHRPGWKRGRPGRRRFGRRSGHGGSGHGRRGCGRGRFGAAAPATDPTAVRQVARTLVRQVVRTVVRARAAAVGVTGSRRRRRPAHRPR